MRRSTRRPAVTLATTFLAALAAPALAGDGPVIEVRMIGTVTSELEGDPGETGLEQARLGDPLVVAARIDMSVAGDTLFDTPLRAQFVGEGVSADGQAGPVFLPTETPTIHVLGDVSEFGGPLFDQIVIHGGSAQGIPVHAYVRLDSSIIDGDALAPMDVQAPDLQLGQITLTPYLAGMWGEVTRIRIRDVTCAADLAGPAGTLDFSDIAAFLTAFADGEPEGDPATPFGVFDFSDVVSFLNAFGAGCP